MKEWAAKRFWTSAGINRTDQGFTVELDGRPVRTPAKAALILPTERMALAVAAEWDAQDEKVDAATMPVTRSANAAIDKVARQFAEAADMLAEYGDCDQICYRALEPARLVQRQSAAWDPLLDWARKRYGARLVPVAGVIHRPQSARSLAQIRKPLDAMTAFELTATHDLVSLSGSLVIGLAAADRAWPVEKLWEWSRIDESWQAEQWGQDELAAADADKRRHAFFAAARFIDMSSG